MNRNSLYIILIAVIIALVLCLSSVAQLLAQMPILYTDTYLPIIGKY